jgi:NTP pyrophosphatase (non-canonical NTP hydrolase)
VKRRPAPAHRSAIAELLAVMARLRAPDGCPWDREQDHRTLRYHAIEEVYELLDAIEAGDDAEMAEELGDLLLQIVFHCQMAAERQAFTFEDVARGLVRKLIHRHPHVFGDAEARTAAAVWEQWDRLKHAEKQGTRHARASALDGIPRRLPALLRAQKLWKKARRANLAPAPEPRGRGPRTPATVARALFELAALCQDRGWSAEELLRTEARRREATWRRAERPSLPRRSRRQEAQPSLVTSTPTSPPS